MKQVNINPKKILIGAGLVIAAIVSVSVLGGSFYTIDEGERGVILRNGKVIGTAAPGLSFKLPIIDDVRILDVKEDARVFTKLLAYSRDQQTASMQVSVNFRVPSEQVEAVYSTYGSIENMVNRLVDRQVPEEVKNVFGRFNAATAIQERDRLSSEIQAAIKSGIKGPVIIESVQTENIDFSDAYEDSIEQRMLAEVEVQKITQNAEREKVQAEIKVIQAQADADSQLAKAKAEAKAIELKGNAEAEAIAARGKALRDNPNLVNLVAVENWNGQLPTTMVPGSAVPFVNVK